MMFHLLYVMGLHDLTLHQHWIGRINWKFENLFDDYAFKTEDQLHNMNNKNKIDFSDFVEANMWATACACVFEFQKHNLYRYGS